jgi:hypothetical protein
MQCTEQRRWIFELFKEIFSYLDENIFLSLLGGESFNKIQFSFGINLQQKGKIN